MSHFIKYIPVIGVGNSQLLNVITQCLDILLLRQGCRDTEAIRDVRYECLPNTPNMFSNIQYHKLQNR
jgi:hypothetical protein